MNPGQSLPAELLEHEQSPYRWVLLAGVWLLYAAFGLVVTSLAPLIPLIEADLELSHVQMGSTIGAWQLVYIFSAIPCGMLLDRIGPRWALCLGGLLMAASVYARGTADDFFDLFLAVMLFGLGGPIISAGAPKVVAEHFTGSSRGLAMGIYMTGPGVGGLISLTMTHPLLLDALNMSWRSVMTLWSVVCVVATIVWIVVASSSRAQLAEHTVHKSASAPQWQVIQMLCKQPAVLLVLAMAIGVFLFNHGLNNWLPELLRTSGMTLREASYWAAVPTVVGLLGSLLIPRLATPGRRFHIIIGLSLSAACASVLLHFQSDGLLFSGLLLQGLARSSLMTVLVLTLIELPGVGERYVGVASGLFFSAAEVGGVLGPVSMGLLYDLSQGFDLGLYMLTAVALMLAVGAVKLRRLSD